MGVEWIMIFVTEKDGPCHREFTWHVGTPFNSSNPDLVEIIQADGDELTWITNHFRNLPTYTGRVVRWYGDQAKAIAWGVHCEGLKFKRS